MKNEWSTYKDERSGRIVISVRNDISVAQISMSPQEYKSKTKEQFNRVIDMLTKTMELCTEKLNETTYK